MTDGDPVVRAEVRDTAQNPSRSSVLAAKTQGHDWPGDEYSLMLSKFWSLELQLP